MRPFLAHFLATLGLGVGVSLLLAVCRQQCLQTVKRAVCSQRGHDPALRRAAARFVAPLGFSLSGLQPLLDHCAARCLSKGVEHELVPAVGACAPHVRVESPLLHALFASFMTLSHGIVAASPRTKAVAVGCKACLPAWLERVLHDCLCDAVRAGRDTSGPLCSLGLGDGETLGRFDLPKCLSLPLLDQSHAVLWGQGSLAVHASRLLPMVLLRDASYRQSQGGVTASHQLRQATSLMPLTVLGCPIDPLSQVLDPFLDALPVNGAPVLQRFLRSAVQVDALLHAGSVP